MTTSISPYRVRDSGLTASDVFAQINRAIYECYGCDYAFGGVGKVVVGSLFDFELLLRAMREHAHFEFVSHRALLAEPCPADRVRVGIRHDVDADIVAAELQAEIEREYDVTASWYVLHTAPYYGRFERGVFVRNNCMAHVYRRLQELGHEVALHTDPLFIYQQHGIDGAQAVRTELEWLREQGIDIRGTVAHNSKSVYGAWNYEIFRDRIDPAWPDEPSSAPAHVEHEGKWAPLRVLDEQSLGLVYEGNEVFWQTHTPLEYGAARFVNQWRWNRHVTRTRAHPDALETPFIDQPRLLDEIASIPCGRYLVLVVHPCYFGARHSPEHRPARRIRRVTTRGGESIGWFAYDPSHVQCVSDDEENEQTFQTINKPNEFGMLDLPIETEPPMENERSILFLGADNIDGTTVPVPVHMHVRLRDLVHEKTDQSARVHTLAFPGMGVTRLWSWFERTHERLRPDIVILGIGAQIVRQNVPAIWSRETGVSITHPAGDYLACDPGARTFEMISASAEWCARRRDPVRLETVPGSNLHVDRVLLEHQPRIANVDVLTFLYDCYRHVCDRLRATGAEVFLLVEDLGRFRESRETARVLELLERIAREAGAPLINPYVLFTQADGRGSAVHANDGRWNQTGHRLAAEAVFRALEERGLITRRAQSAVKSAALPQPWPRQSTT